VRKLLCCKFTSSSGGPLPSKPYISLKDRERNIYNCLPAPVKCMLVGIRSGLLSCLVQRLIQPLPDMTTLRGMGVLASSGIDVVSKHREGLQGNEG